MSTEAKDKPIMMTYQQAAKEFGYKYQTLRQYACKGRLRTHTDLNGRIWVTPKAVVELMLNRHPKGRSLEQRQREQARQHKPETGA